MEINLTFLRSLMQKLLENPNVTEWYLFYLRVINVKAERGVSHNRIITTYKNEYKFQFLLQCYTVCMQYSLRKTK